MAKFTNKDLRLKTNEKASFGDSLNANIWWNGSDLILDSTISGVHPTSSGHLTTKQYVDDEISALSSGIVLNHGALTGLDQDDHLQYVPTDASRGFTSSVSGINPTQSYHLTTKYYVDDLVSTASGAIVAQIPSLTGYATETWVNNNFIDNSEMTTISGDIVAQIPTDYISESEMTTISGDIVAQIITDHGDLSGLNDDDHPQYVLVDGSRGFTSTVSGVMPTQDYHLATKEYVDQGGIDRHGRQAIGNGVSQITVNFSDLGHTDYTVNATLENISDSPPSIYAFIVTARTSSSFVVTLMGDIDSSNYVLNWSVIED
jgi:hypothetical protein